MPYYNLISNALVLNEANMSNFHSLEVVCLGSETQRKVDENLNKITLGIKG